ncbi:flavin-containing monooxygenase [Agromyces soli]
MRADVDVLVIGAGQAGLAVSHELTAEGVEHVVLEGESVGSAWASRWDSFTLVTPNRFIRMPGGEYRGPDASGFLPRDAVVAHLRRYADSFGAPVEEDRPVTALRPGRDGGFEAETPLGGILARRVVVATGAYQHEYRPAWARELARRVPVLGSSEYRSPADVPGEGRGAVLVAGGGQSAVQLTDELYAAGRDVVLAAGSAPAIPRRIGGRDTVEWLEAIGFYEQVIEAQPSPTVRFASNPLVTGAQGGHDLNLRTLADEGVHLCGRVLGVDGDRVVVADDLAASVAKGDAGYRLAWQAAATASAEWDLPAPPPLPPESPPPAAVEPPHLDRIAAVLVACGYRPDYGWIEVDGLVDEQGFPLQEGGRSLRAPGLWFVGVPWMTCRKSPLLMGVGEDATAIARELAAA